MLGNLRFEFLHKVKIAIVIFTVEVKQIKNFVTLFNPKYAIPSIQRLKAPVEAKYEKERLKVIA
jgi:hypothetical protein